MRPSDGESLDTRTPDAKRAGTVIGRVALGFLAAALLIEIWFAVAHPYMNGDTSSLVFSSARAVDCLRHLRFTSCDKMRDLVAGSPQAVPGVGPRPLLQYLPAVALRAIGLSHDANLRTLIAIDAAAICALVALFWVAAQRVADAIWAPVLAVAVVASPLLWYGTSGFGEALAAFVVGAAVAATLLRWPPPVVALLVAVACLSKETNPPFVFALAAMCALAVARTPRDKRFQLIAIAAGTVVGAAANAGFNVFRYGTIRNTLYLTPAFQVSDRATVVRAFGALWVAPNGGVVWFWPFAVAILALATGASLRHIVHAPSWRRFGTVLVAVLLVVQVAGLATWFSPFGWIAWGPRLMLPLLPAMMLVAAVLGGADAARALRRLLTGPWFWPAAVATMIAALPQAAVLDHPHAFVQFFGDPRCRNAHISSNPDRYYACIRYLAWTKRPWLLQRGLEGLGAFGGRIFAVVLSAAILSLLLLARERAHTSMRAEAV